MSSFFQWKAAGIFGRFCWCSVLKHHVDLFDEIGLAGLLCSIVNTPSRLGPCPYPMTRNIFKHTVPEELV